MVKIVFKDFPKEMLDILTDSVIECRAEYKTIGNARLKIFIFFKFSLFILIIAVIASLLIIIYTISFPILLFIPRVRKKLIVKKSNEPKPMVLRPRQFYNPGYDKLIFSLTGNYLGEESEEFHAIKKKYDEYDFFAFPIIFSFDLQDRIFRKTNIRDRFEKEGVGLFILEIDKCYDDGGESRLEVFPTFSNTNYSYPTEDQEMSGAALSVIFDIEIDGIDKLIVWSKGCESEFSFIPLAELEGEFEITRIVDRTKWPVLLQSTNVLGSLSEYLSLRWENSTLQENAKLKESAAAIRERLFERFITEDNPENINICKLVGPRKPMVYYSKDLDDNYESQIKKLTLTKPLDDIHREFPEFSIETLHQWKVNEIDNCIYRILAIKDLDYKSKIFLKSANLVARIIEDDEADYSAVTIGYSKFFEREINLSLVQLIRKEIGIPMPLCFDRYYEVKQDFMVEVREDYNVNFNMKDYLGGNYLPPGLGQSLNTFKKLGPQISAYVPSYLKLVQEGKKLNAIRNRSAHAELIGKEDLLNIKEALVSLYVNGIFREMLDTKNSLKTIH